MEKSRNNMHRSEQASDLCHGWELTEGVHCIHCTRFSDDLTIVGGCYRELECFQGKLKMCLETYVLCMYVHV